MRRSPICARRPKPGSKSHKTTMLPVARYWAGPMSIPKRELKRGGCARPPNPRTRSGLLRLSAFTRLFVLILVLSANIGCGRSATKGTTARPLPPRQGPASAPPATEPADAFKVIMTLRDNDGEEATVMGVIYFVGDHAAQFLSESNAQPEAIFDLREMTWRDLDSSRTVHQSDRNAWLKASAKRAEASLANATVNNSRRFVETLLDPRFKITSNGNPLILTNDLFNYEIRSTQTISNSQRASLYSYETLNAYRMAMKERELPPVSELEIIKQLTMRNMIPSEMIVTALKPNGSPKMKLIMRTDVRPMKDEEKTRIAALLEKTRILSAN